MNWPSFAKIAAGAGSVDPPALGNTPEVRTDVESLISRAAGLCVIPFPSTVAPHAACEFTALRAPAHAPTTSDPHKTLICMTSPIACQSMVIGELRKVTWVQTRSLRVLSLGKIATATRLIRGQGPGSKTGSRPDFAREYQLSTVDFAARWSVR